MHGSTTRAQVQQQQQQQQLPQERTLTLESQPDGLAEHFHVLHVLV